MPLQDLVENIGDIEALLSKRTFKVDIREVIASENEIVSLEDSVGRICAEYFMKCPPGYPLLIHGEVILEEHVKILREQ